MEQEQKGDSSIYREKGKGKVTEKEKENLHWPDIDRGVIGEKEGDSKGDGGSTEVLEGEKDKKFIQLQKAGGTFSNGGYEGAERTWCDGIGGRVKTPRKRQHKESNGVSPSVDGDVDIQGGEEMCWEGNVGLAEFRNGIQPIGQTSMGLTRPKVEQWAESAKCSAAQNNSQQPKPGTGLKELSFQQPKSTRRHSPKGDRSPATENLQEKGETKETASSERKKAGNPGSKIREVSLEKRLRQITASFKSHCYGNNQEEQLQRKRKSVQEEEHENGANKPKFEEVSNSLSAAGSLEGTRCSK